MIKKRIPRFGLMFLTSIVILFFFNISRVQAAYDSNISINPLYANGITIKNGQLNLSFPTVGSEGTLTYVPSGSNIPFHARYANEKYVGIDIIRDEKVIFTTSVNGDTKQEVLTNALSNLKVKDTDILHFYLAEPTKEGVTNFEKETSLPADKFKGYFQKDMYYMMTYGGFIPVNNGISHLMYDENKIRTSATQMSSLFSGNILNFGYSGSKDYNFLG